MTGGLLQLVATGVQDIYLIGNPQITFFKVVYQRHTNFSMESISSPGDGDLNFGNKIVFKVPRNGDLAYTMLLQVDLPQLQSTQSSGLLQWVYGIGHAMISKIEVEIGGQVVDRQYGEWMEIWSQLSTNISKKYAYDQLVYRIQNRTAGPITVNIPLQFWFNRNIGLALPLIALQYHEVKINVYFRPLDQLYTFGPNYYFVGSKTGNTVSITSNNPEFKFSDIGNLLYWPDGSIDTITGYTNTLTVTVATSGTQASGTSFYMGTSDTLLAGQNYKIVDARLFTDFIYLDTYERKKFAQMRHSYLIEQIQYNEAESYTFGQINKKFTLNYNLPVKALYWIAQLDDVALTNNWYNFSNTVNPLLTQGDPIVTAQLFLNGTERFEERSASYFRLVQPLNYHTTTPDTFIYMYSFALKPEELQPSGQCNMSKIDIVDLNVSFPQLEGNSQFRCYAINYNVLRIFSGMAGVAFSN